MISEKRATLAKETATDLFQSFGPMADFQYKELFEQSLDDKVTCDSMYRMARVALVRGGYIRDSGATAVNPDTGHAQTVWEACEIDPPIVPKCPTCGGRRKPLRAAQTTDASASV